MNFLVDLDRKKIALSVLKVALSIGLLFYIVKKADLGAIITTIQTVKIEFYFYAVGVFFISVPIRALRWGIFLKEKRVHVPQTKLLLLYFIGMFFNTFLPTIFAGDAVRTYYIYKEYHSPEIPATSVIMERFCGLLTLFLIGLFSSLYWLLKFSPSSFVKTSFAISLVAVCAMTLLISPSFHRRISTLLQKVNLKAVWAGSERIYNSFQGYTKNRKALSAGIVLSFLTSATTIIIAYCLSLSLSWQVPLHVFFFTLPIITITTMIPVSFGGVGVRETAFFLVFSQFGVAGPSAIALALLWYSINLISGSLGGLCYAFYRQVPRKPRHVGGDESTQF